MTGTAAQLLWGSENLSYEELLDKLKRRFSGKGMEKKFQSELRCRRRNRGESLRELAHDIRRLMTLTYPGEQSSLSEHIARDAFLSALADPEFELKVREREPADLDDALRIAQRYDVFKSAVDFSTSSRPRVNRQAAGFCSKDESSSEFEKDTIHQRKSVLVMQNGVGTNANLKPSSLGKFDDDLPWKEEIIQRLDNLETTKTVAEQQMERMVQENTVLRKEVEKLRYLEQLRAFSNQVPKPQLLQSNESLGGLRHPETRTAGLCFKCGRPGHIKRNCPYRGQPLLQRNEAEQCQVQAKSLSKG